MGGSDLRENDFHLAVHACINAQGGKVREDQVQQDRTQMQPKTWSLRYSPLMQASELVHCGRYLLVEKGLPLPIYVDLRLSEHCVGVDIL